MGRLTIPDAAADCDSIVVDLSARERPAETELLDRIAPLHAARSEPAGPEPGRQRSPNRSAQEAVVPPDIGLDRLWFQLPEGDRRRFGSCFSGMLLKALGHRS